MRYVKYPWTKVGDPWNLTGTRPVYKDFKKRQVMILRVLDMKKD